MRNTSADFIPPAFTPPENPDNAFAWLEWLDANRLTPAAARILADTPLPAQARSHLDASYTQARAQWLLRKTALRAFLKLAAQAPAQPVILLKGAALALTLYEDPATRPMNDIDVLVAPAHLQQIVNRMRETGYLEHSLGEDDNIGYLHHFILIDPVTNIRFELHRTLPLLPESGETLDWFLHEISPGAIDDTPFATFSPAAQVLHLSSHAILEHGGAQSALAIWFYDLDQLIRRRGERIDWEKTLYQARQIGWEAALQEALRLTHKLFATPIPPAIESWLQLPQTGLSGYNTLRQMTSINRSSSLTAFHILRGLSWPQRIQQLTHMMFPSRAYIQRRYPGVPWLLAYPYRWFNAARKLFPILFRK